MDQMKMLREELARCCPALELREQEPMSRHTSFHIGGPAALMALPKSREEAACAVRTAAGLGPGGDVCRCRHVRHVRPVTQRQRAVCLCVAGRAGFGRRRARLYLPFV